MRKRPQWLWLGAFFLTATGACSGGGEGSGLGPAQLFSRQVEEITIEIDYQPGAEPYTTPTTLSGNPWYIFRDNLLALFEKKSGTVNVPVSLSKMERLDGVDAKTFTAQEIVEIADRYRDQPDTPEHRSFYFLFLAGKYAEEGQANGLDVLGLSLSGTSIIVIFKPVVEAFDAADAVEQITINHEFGHGIGLVDDGLPMVRDHRDDAHEGAHCINSDCLMYYLYEGPQKADEVISRVKSGNRLLFGPECLADAHAASH